MRALLPQGGHRRRHPNENPCVSTAQLRQLNTQLGGPAMEEFPLHRHYLHYSELPYSQRVLYTAVLLVLGSAYIFALLQINFTYAGRAGGNGKVASYQD